MGIKSRLSSSLTASEAPEGFDLLVPSTLQFKNASEFETALKVQHEHTAVMDADPDVFERIGIDGQIDGTDWRLSKAAFGDLCNFAGVPVAFIRRLALLNEQQALEVMETMIAKVFHASAPKSLVLDTREGRVDGIVGKGTYSHIANKDALAYLLTAIPDLEMSSGWLSGPNMRVAAIIKTKPFEVKKGDVVHFGVNLTNAIHGDRSLKVAEYIERLVCTNGAIATEQGHFTAIVHRGDVAYNTQKAVVDAASHADHILPRLQSAPKQMMMETDIFRIRDWLKEPKNGGSDGLDIRVTKAAMAEAQKENRVAEETTLWNWHNAITAVAKESPSMNRQAELEAMGYKALIRFGAILTN
jgi:hypothetical protein